MKNVRNVAVILSGGSGSRFGGELPKQFTKLSGRSIIEYTIDAFEGSDDIDEILIVSQAHDIARTWEIIKENNWRKVGKVIAGGKERFYSTYSALQALATYSCNTKVLFHDAVRPLVDRAIISNCIAALDQYQAVDVVVPSADTLVEVDAAGSIVRIPERAYMRRGQTPQGFRLGVLMKAYQKAIEIQRDSFTCDCGVLKEMLPNIAITTVVGNEKNLKITHPIDLFIAEKYIQAGTTLDPISSVNLVGLKAKNIVIFGGGSGIGLEMKNMAKARGANVLVASRSHNGVDVSCIKSVRAYLADAARELGHIDYVVNTAGVLIKRPLSTLSADEVSLLIDANYKGVAYVAIAAKPYLAQSQGMLLNFTSSSYTRGRALYALYSSAKAAVVNLTQALADEWAHRGVRVNCINPERTATRMRTANFGVEPPELLLPAGSVAKWALKALLSDVTGVIVDVRKDGR